MELRINLATASLKDAEHAMFIIGAYFGLTQAVVAGARLTIPAQDMPAAYDGAQAQAAAFGAMPATSAQDTAQAADPAATFGAIPPALPPGAGESPMMADAAQVFGGNVPSPAPVAPQGMPATLTPNPATVAPSAGTVAGPVGSPVPQAPAPGASAPSGVETDATGLPWDGRIHASGEGGTKPKNADGKWRKKRGLNDGELVARVEAELRATMAAGAPVLVGAATSAASGSTPAVAAPPAPPAPPVPTAPPVASSTPAAGGVLSASASPATFEQLMPRITAGIVSGKLPATALSMAAAQYGIAQVPMLSNRPDLIPSVWTHLVTLYPDLAA